MRVSRIAAGGAGDFPPPCDVAGDVRPPPAPPVSRPLPHYIAFPGTDFKAAHRARLAATERRLSRVQGRVNLGPLGVVDVAGMPLITATVMIAFVDGFNPCSIWVLTVLLAMILGSRSRMHVAAVNSFVRETACGSGSVALHLFNGAVRVKQPTGRVITVTSQGDLFPDCGPGLTHGLTRRRRL